MLRKSAAVLAVVSCLANVNATRAEPGPVVNWLMDEPASLFDIGILRTEITLASINSNTFIRYDWDKNRIYLHTNFVTAIQETDGKQFCKLLIDRIRTFGGVSGGGTLPHAFSNFARNFAHHDYRSAKTPDDYLRKLDQIIEIKGSVETPDTATKCHGPLVSDKVYFEE